MPEKEREKNKPPEIKDKSREKRRQDESKRGNSREPADDYETPKPEKEKKPRITAEEAKRTIEGIKKILTRWEESDDDKNAVINIHPDLAEFVESSGVLEFIKGLEMKVSIRYDPEEIIIIENAGTREKKPHCSVSAIIDHGEEKRDKERLERIKKRIQTSDSSTEKEKPKEFPYQDLIKELEKIDAGESVIVWLNTDVSEKKASEIQEQVDCSPVFMETKSYAKKDEFQLTFPVARIESKGGKKFPREQILQKIQELKSEQRWLKDQYVYINISEEDWEHAERPESTLEAQLETIDKQLKKIGLKLGVIPSVPYLEQGQVEIHLPPDKITNGKEAPRTSPEKLPKKSEEKPESDSIDKLSEEERDEYRKIFLKTYHALRDQRLISGKLAGGMEKAYQSGARAEEEIKKFLTNTYGKPETPKAPPLKNVLSSEESPESEKKVSIPELIKELEKLPANTPAFAYLNSEDLDIVRKEEKEIKDAVMCSPVFRHKSSLPRGQFEIVAGDIKNESKQPEATTEDPLPPSEVPTIKQTPAPSETEEKQPEVSLETEKDKFIQRLIQEIKVFPINHEFTVHLNPEDADVIQDEIERIKEAVEGKPIFIPDDDVPKGEIRIPERRQQKEEGVPPPEAEPEKEKSLEDKLTEKRKEYLEAKRLRGKFAGKGKYKGKEKGLEALAKIGEEYNDLRSKYIQEKVGKELESQNLESEELNQTIVEKLLKEYDKEDERVEKMISDRERGRWQKFKEWWRKHPKSRMAVAFGLTAFSTGSVLTGQLWLTPLTIMARAGFSGVNTTIGTEGAIAKHSKRLGEKGLVNKFAELTPEQEQELKKIKGRKNKKSKTQELLAQNAEEKIKNYTPEQFASEIAPELARLRTLRERKGKKLEEVGPYGGVIAALCARESELLKQEVLQAMEGNKQEKEVLIAKALSESLDRQTREMDRGVELAGEKERKKALWRWGISGAAGALATAGTVWLGLRHYKNVKAKAGMTAPEEMAPVVPAEIAPEDFTITAQKGDSVWTMAKKAVENSKTYGEKFKDLDQAQKTYVIDAIKDRVAENPKGFGLTDVDIVKPGQDIDLSEFFSKEGVVEEFLGKAGKLSKGQIENILSNNKIIREFQDANPGVRMTSDQIKEILSQGGQGALEKTVQSSAATAAERVAREAGERTISGLGSGAGQGVQASTSTGGTGTVVKKAVGETAKKTTEAALETTIEDIRQNWKPKKILEGVQKIAQDKEGMKNIREVSGLIQKNLKNPQANFEIPKDLSDNALEEIGVKIGTISEPTKSKEGTLLDMLRTIMRGQ